MFFVYLTSGLFLGWSLGANDAANVFGTAVATRMVRFRVAATLFSAFVVLGATLAGAGASDTLGRLGAVNALPGSFTVALAAALAVTWMTRLQLPVSTSQAIVGAIIGWNLFSGSLTDWGSLSRIVTSWVACPLLAAAFAIVLFKLTELVLGRVRIHLFRLDHLTRTSLIAVGSFASFSLGANNIANVMGVFVPAAPFDDLDVFGLFTLTGPQQLFLIGGIAISVGVFTYSRRVMLTVGSELFRLSPIAALIVVLAQALVLFVFASEALESWLAAHGLPTVPLVPVSSSQAVIGAVLGIGLAKGGRNVRYRVLGRIAWGWVTTPVAAGTIAFVALFFVQNVFAQRVYEPVRYRVSHEVLAEAERRGLDADGLDALAGEEFDSARAFVEAVREVTDGEADAVGIAKLAAIRPLRVDVERLRPYWDAGAYTEEQLHAVFRLHGRCFTHPWQLDAALAALTPDWRPRPATLANKAYNKELAGKLDHLHGLFALPTSAGDPCADAGE